VTEWPRGPAARRYRQQKDITILDRFNNAAVVKIVASGWVDYLEEAKVDGQWKIINVAVGIETTHGATETYGPEMMKRRGAETFASATLG
jgi:hypothetical protein